MALSTSIPIAIMNPASDVRFSPTPKKDMISSVHPIENISDEPIRTPARSPITSMIITSTIKTVSYTHLDVYKRQYVPRVDQLVKVAPAIIEMGCFARVETNGGQ